MNKCIAAPPSHTLMPVLTSGKQQGGEEGQTYTLFLLFVGHTVIKDGIEYHVLNERDSISNRFRSIEFAALAYDLSRMLPNMYTIIIDQSTRETFNDIKHGQILCPNPVETDELMTCKTPMDPQANDAMQKYDYRSNTCSQLNFIILSQNQPETEIVRNMFTLESILTNTIGESIRNNDDVIEIPRLFESLQQSNPSISIKKSKGLQTVLLSKTSQIMVKSKAIIFANTQ